MKKIWIIPLLIIFFISLASAVTWDNPLYFLKLVGGSLTGNLNMTNNNITDVNYLNPEGTEINIGGNLISAGNLTGNYLFGNLEWDYLTAYPTACTDYQVGVGDVLTCGVWGDVKPGKLAGYSRIVTVDEGGNAQFTDIQTAIEFAVSGCYNEGFCPNSTDRVLVYLYPGYYNITNAILLRSGVDLVGASKGSVTIEKTDRGDGISCVGNNRIADIKLIAGDLGIYTADVGRNNILIEDVIMKDNNHLLGVYTLKSHNVTIRNCEINSNREAVFIVGDTPNVENILIQNVWAKVTMTGSNTVYYIGGANAQLLNSYGYGTENSDEITVGDNAVVLISGNTLQMGSPEDSFTIECGDNATVILGDNSYDAKIDDDCIITYLDTGKVNKAGDTMTGNLNMSGKNITNVNYINPGGDTLYLGGNLNVSGGVVATTVDGVMGWANLTSYPTACTDYQIGVGDVLTCGTWDVLDKLYCKLTGCNAINMSGNINMTNNNITNVNYINPEGTPLLSKGKINTTEAIATTDATGGFYGLGAIKGVYHKTCDDGGWGTCSCWNTGVTFTTDADDVIYCSAYTGGTGGTTDGACMTFWIEDSSNNQKAKTSECWRYWSYGAQSTSVSYAEKPGAGTHTRRIDASVSGGALRCQDWYAITCLVYDGVRTTSFA